MLKQMRRQNAAQLFSVFSRSSLDRELKRETFTAWCDEVSSKQKQSTKKTEVQDMNVSSISPACTLESKPATLDTTQSEDRLHTAGSERAPSPAGTKTIAELPTCVAAPQGDDAAPLANAHPASKSPSSIAPCTFPSRTAVNPPVSTAHRDLTGDDRGQPKAEASRAFDDDLLSQELKELSGANEQMQLP
eukprot:gnl/TRDRNA2_/TRDRNA2_212957_c0_seq1.p1 gnl/TRDRNA2_/TRDRNA2_212957_c0~~gnl/TRDRNA2_/TRDRNA2_212957_c0_seq1.p1  ORF type:complete len:190 (+),score=32.55 gnl/TRDRNA2_/TRDRNA2_212957_c0_seq1:43-612(+)